VRIWNLAKWQNFSIELNQYSNIRSIKHDSHNWKPLTQSPKVIKSHFFFKRGLRIPVSCSLGLITAQSLFVHFVESLIPRQRCNVQLSGNKILSKRNQVWASHTMEVRSRLQCVCLICEDKGEESSATYVSPYHGFRIIHYGSTSIWSSGGLSTPGPSSRHSRDNMSMNNKKLTTGF
jgi:hypothetical protein